MLQITHSLCIAMSHVVLFASGVVRPLLQGGVFTCKFYILPTNSILLVNLPTIASSFNHFFCFTVVSPTNPPKLGGVAPPPPLPTPLVCAYREKLNISTRELQKFYQRSYIVNLSDLCNVIKKILDKISCHRDRYFTLSIEIGQNTVIKILPKKLYRDFK